jgi:protocatechuate 4,5-dioxygenase alpha chain
MQTPAQSPPAVALSPPGFDLEPPGTFLYTGPVSTRGFGLNRFCLSLKSPQNRQEFLADEAGYVAGYGLTGEEAALVKARDWTGLLEAGGHLQAVLKLAATLGLNLYHVGGHALGIDAAQMQAACPRIVSRLPGQDAL